MSDASCFSRLDHFPWTTSRQHESHQTSHIGHLQQYGVREHVQHARSDFGSVLSIAKSTPSRICNRLQTCTANAKMLLNPRVASNLSSNDSTTTLLGTVTDGALDIVVFGRGSEFVAAVMDGLTPAIEGEAGPTPEVAMRKCLMTTCELLKEYIPKVGEHHRNVPGGGVFKADIISKAWTK